MTLPVHPLAYAVRAAWSRRQTKISHRIPTTPKNRPDIRPLSPRHQKSRLQRQKSLFKRDGWSFISLCPARSSGLTASVGVGLLATIDSALGSFVYGKGSGALERRRSRTL